MRQLLAALTLLGLSVPPLLSLAVPPTWTVVVNGQPLHRRAVLVRGQVYVPLDALNDLGVPVTETGREIRLGPVCHLPGRGTVGACPEPGGPGGRPAAPP